MRCSNCCVRCLRPQTADQFAQAVREALAKRLLSVKVVKDSIDAGAVVVYTDPAMAMLMVRALPVGFWTQLDALRHVIQPSSIELSQSCSAAGAIVSCWLHC